MPIFSIIAEKNVAENRWIIREIIPYAKYREKKNYGYYRVYGVAAIDELDAYREFMKRVGQEEVD